MLTLRGVSRTDWPEGIGPGRLEQTESVPLLSVEASVSSRTSPGGTAPVRVRAAAEAALKEIQTWG